MIPMLLSYSDEKVTV